MMQSLLLAGGGGGGGLTLISAISGAGLSSGLQVCCDAGDFQSYIGSGDSWLDRSPNGFYFVRGSGTGTSASDPTFNGPAGYIPAYWSHDGAQFFSYHGATNEAVFQTIHQDNASFSMVGLVYVTSSGNVFLCGDAIDAATGFSFGLRGLRTRMRVANGGATVLDVTGSAVSFGAWHMIGVSVSEAVGSGFYYVDGGYSPVAGADTFNATYATPSAGAATSVMTVAGLVATGDPAGTRTAFFALWNRALTKANFDSIWALIRSRFGL